MKQQLFVLALCIISILSEVVSRGHHARISGGEIAEPHSAPFATLLRVKYSDIFGWLEANGALITPQTVLTAANSVYLSEDSISSGVDVVLGAHHPDVDEDTQVIINSTAIITHPGWHYDNWEKDNIAIIQLFEPAVLQDIINVIPLPSDNRNDYSGDIATVYGWGMVTQTTIDEFVPRTVQMPIILNSDCKEKYPHIDDGDLCTSGDGGKSLCIGDNGAPLVSSTGESIGLGAFIVTNCGSGEPSGFVRVSNYLDWINENTI